MSASILDRVLHWGGARRGRLFSRCTSLGPWCGERLEIAVDQDEAVLLVRDGEVEGVFLVGHHVACVLRPGELRGDLSETERAQRLRVDVDEYFRMQSRVRWLPCEAELLFVALGAIPEICFGEDHPTVFADPERGRLELELHGAARLHVSDPVRFFQSFLRNADGLAESDFDRITRSLVHTGLGQVLQRRYGEVDAIERDWTRLARHAARDLSVSLAPVGLAVEEIELTRFETPVGDRSIEPSSPLVSPAPRG